MQRKSERYSQLNNSTRKLVKELCKWKLSGIICVFFVVLCPSKGYCITGTDWQVTGSRNLLDDEQTYTTAYINVSYIDPNTKRFYIEKSEIGKFGDGKIGSAEGILVHVTSAEGDHNGCAAPLKSTWGNGSLPKEPWIALVKRGQCSFEVKTENAYRHNASAVLIYNDRETPILDKMKLNSINTGTRNMSAIFTYKWKGEQLARLVDNGSRVMTHITIAARCLRSTTQFNRTSVLFVSIAFVVLMLISMAWLVFYYVQRFRYMYAKERLSKRLCNAAKKALSKIPTKEIQQEDSEVQGEGECCAVCIEPYKVTDDLRILPCSHKFHKTCIDPWLLDHRTCPMCKMDILKHYGFVFSNSQESILEIDADRDMNAESASFEGITDDGDALGLRSESEDQMMASASSYEVIPTGSDANELSDDLQEGCEHCMKCRCRGKPSSEGRSSEDCCLIKKAHDNQGSAEPEEPRDADPDTAQLLRKGGALESDAAASGPSSPPRKKYELGPGGEECRDAAAAGARRRNSSQMKSGKFFQNGNCDTANGDGCSWRCSAVCNSECEESDSRRTESSDLKSAAREA